jgi:Tfp pilus assembly protein PilF
MLGKQKSLQAVTLAAAMAICLSGCQHVKGLLASRQEVPNASGQLASSTGQGTSAASTAKHMDDKMARARSLEKDGQIEQAIGVCREVVKEDSSRVDAHHRLAILHDMKGECDKASGFYRAALERDPRNVEVLCDFGYSCYLQKRWAEAEEHLIQALTLQPDMARAHNNLGLLLARTGRQDAAMTEFGRAGCTEADARANVAFTLTLEQQWEAARQQYELALAVDSSSTAAQKGLDALRSVDSQAQACNFTTSGKLR